MAGELHGIEEARARLLAAARVVAGTETVTLDAAVGRVLAEPVVAAIDVPPHDNSAMDGYAVASGDCRAADVALTVSQRIPAGVAGTPLIPGTAARIFTGAPLPLGADAVVMQENCTVADGVVRFSGPVPAGRNVRRAGEDISSGSEVLPAGRRLGPADIGLAASVGSGHLTVHRRPRVALFSTGDELREPGEALAPGQIYNSNRPMLRALLRSCGCEVVDLGRVADTLEATRDALASVATQADVILTTGGVSVGEEDHVRTAVQQLGALDLWKIAIKPGKPLAFGRVGSTPVVGLPGNPVSAFVTWTLFVAPYLTACGGATVPAPTHYTVTADFDWPKPGNRTEYLRVQLAGDPVRARLYPTQSSGALSSVSWASGLAVIAPGQVVKAGDAVRYLPLPGSS